MKQLTVLLPIVLIILVINVNQNESAKILGIFSTSAKSHWIVGSSLMKNLAKKGHEVTVISPYTFKEPVPNLREIAISGIVEQADGMTSKLLDMPSMSFPTVVKMLYDFGFLCTNWTMHDPGVQNLLNSNEKFDLIILEIFLNNAMLGFGHHFNAPIIAMSTFGASKWTNDLVGTPSPPSYVPSPFLSFTDRMNYFQRIGNMLSNVVDNVMEYYDDSLQVPLYESVFKSPKPTMGELKKNAVSLVLLNHHFSLGTPRPYATNMIEVGGMHINRVPNPLPEDIKAILDNSTEGVVYFSMGSNIKSTILPNEKRQIFLDVFRGLKQKVLWKWEDETLPDKPDNVIIKKWWPQDDILSHPNVKVFITHGGLGSTTETLYHGVPVIGIPIFGDQELNMAKAVRGGYGLLTPYKDLSVEGLSSALNQLLSDKKFANKAKEVSKRYRDQPLNPLDTATFWVEYVLRHNGAHHLISAAQELSFIQYHSLDVLATIIFVPILFVLLLKALICKFVCKAKKPVRKTDKKTN